MSVIPTIATVVGSSVSSAVYTSIVTTGDLGATALGRGLNYLGKGIGYGAELLGSSRFATLSRAAGEAGEIVAAPAIRASSKTFALGASIVIGTAAGLVTAGIAHGSVALYGYGVAAYERYKDPFVAAVSDAAAVASETVLARHSLAQSPSLNCVQAQVMKKIQPIELTESMAESEPALVTINEESVQNTEK